MGMFKHCKCGHIEEDHAMDAPEGERECMAEVEDNVSGCDCPNFEEEEEDDR